MSSDLESLRKRAQLQAQQDQIREEQERIAAAEFGRAAAREDIETWKLCIEKQMRSGGWRRVGIFHDTSDYHKRVTISCTQGLLAEIFGANSPTGYRRVRDLGRDVSSRGKESTAWSAYVGELGHLLGSPFRVSGGTTSSSEVRGYTEDGQGNRSYDYAYGGDRTYVYIDVKW